MAEKEKRMEEIYRQYRNNIYHLCLLYLKDLQRAEDAMQETFFRAWKRFDTYRGDSGEKTWLSAIAANVCRDWLRTPWLRLERKSVPWDEVILQAAETQKDMDAVRAVMSLPTKLREVITLRYYQEMTVPEIAEALRLSVSGVNARLAKAKNRLRPELREVYFNA